MFKLASTHLHARTGNRANPLDTGDTPSKSFIFRFELAAARPAPPAGGEEKGRFGVRGAALYDAQRGGRGFPLRGATWGVMGDSLTTSGLEATTPTTDPPGTPSEDGAVCLRYLVRFPFTTPEPGPRALTVVHL